MELSKLKKRLVTAVRGHKLLKDKQDELMRRFIELVRHNDRLRKQIEQQLMEAYRAFAMSAAVISQQFLEEALLIPKERISLAVTTKNVMSVNVPVMKFTRESESGGGGEESESSLYPYGFYNTSDETDRAIERLYKLLPDLLELAEVEKSVNLMADEIEKTRRRVNALEYMTIPQLNETIAYIKMKLDSLVDIIQSATSLRGAGFNVLPQTEQFFRWDSDPIV
jgi:V/A-type H+-transporting ATPase subunit D